MLLDLLKKSTLQMKSIAINFYFQLELSSVFLCNCIPPGTLYFNSLKFSSFCNREKNTVHLQFEKMRLPLSLSAFQRLCLSFLEKNLKGNCLNGSWFAFMISFQGNVLPFFPLLKFYAFFVFVDRGVSWDPLWQPWQKGHSLPFSFFQQNGTEAPPAHSHSASLYSCRRWRKAARCWPWAEAARKRLESDVITTVASPLVLSTFWNVLLFALKKKIIRNFHPWSTFLHHRKLPLHFPLAAFLYSWNYFVYIFVAFWSCIVHLETLHKKCLCLWAQIHVLPSTKLLHILRKLPLHLTASRMCWKLFQRASLNVIHRLALNVEEVWIFISQAINSQVLLFLSFEVKTKRHVF